jgi:hypothetical protein
MIDSVKFFAGITVGSSCLPEPPAPMKRMLGALEALDLGVLEGRPVGALLAVAADDFFMISSTGMSSSSFGRGWRATPWGTPVE